MKKTILTLLLILSVFFIFNNFKVLGNVKIENIAITFGNSEAERNFIWTTKGSGNKDGILAIWTNEKDLINYKAKSQVVNGYKDYYADQGTFYSDRNKTSYTKYEATASDLKKGVTYFYKCGDGTNWSETNSFFLPSDEEYSFIYITDPQSASESDFKIYRRTIETSLNKYPDTAFTVIAGDLVDIGGSEALWDRFFSFGKSLTTKYTVAPAIGNHETDFGPSTFDDHFNFPDNENLPPHVYSFDYGDARFFVLSTEMTYYQMFMADSETQKNAEYLITEQISWLKEKALENPKKWNIVIFHKTFYPSGGYYGDGTITALKKRFEPVFDELSIDAVLSGHDHTFTKAYKYNFENVKNASEGASVITKTDETKGTLYLTNNTAGPKFYAVNPDANFNFLCYQPRKQMYTNVKVSKDSLKFDTYAVSENEDTLYDTIEIKKYD